MELHIGEQSCVYQGQKMEEISWGYVQFPKLYQMKNGNIGLYVHDDDDSWVSLDADTSGKWFVSEDKGKSWKRATKEEIDMMGTVLPGGDVVRVKCNQNVSLTGVKQAPWHYATYRIPSDDLTPQKSKDPNELPMPITAYTDIFDQKYNVYWLDTLPDGMIEKRFCFKRLKNGESEAKTTYSEVEWKHRTVQSFPPSHATKKDLEKEMLFQAGLFGCRTVKVAPDGSLYIAHYRACGADPFTGVYHGTSEAYILRSIDNGDTWKMQGYIPYQPDESKDPFAHLHKGFYEPDIEFMPDGSILCILRTCMVFYGAPEWGPTYLSRSLDGGKTWSKPEYFKDRGALPLLLQLKNGVTLAVITRPGIYVYASKDSGKTWETVAEVMTEQDRSKLANVPPERPNFHQWAGSCCNCSIQVLSEDKALLAYSDFYYPDEKGVKKKSVLTVEITAER